ncbi:hypothetical protein JYU34_004428 [Plutella xylostella]|uniref:FLYWCH-type domain-containing protein n=1 Tax=Plutella xylostella TaxID=51655 RepID=A0ABQ7QY34_PLUXY|nr:hypothetical protein JYU34_004428 [Plutella xylostella]
MIKTSDLKKAFIFQGFTYNRPRRKGDGLRLFCSSYRRGCKALVFTTKEFNLVEVTGFHTHPRPRLHYCCRDSLK